MPPRRTFAGIVALLTCPCHIVPLVLLAGGTAGGAFLSRHFPVVMGALVAAFLLSLWVLLRPDPSAVAAGGARARDAGDRG